MRSNKRKPIETQIAEGDPRKRGVNKLQRMLQGQPKPTPALPECPAHLEGHARDMWNLWTEELAVMNLEKKPDAAALTAACAAYETTVLAYIALTKEGRVLKEPITGWNKESGKEEIVGYKSKQNPWVMVEYKAQMMLKSFCAEFGFTPVSRTRLAVEKKPDAAADLYATLTAAREPKEAVQ